MSIVLLLYRSYVKLWLMLHLLWGHKHILFNYNDDIWAIEITLWLIFITFLVASMLLKYLNVHCTLYKHFFDRLCYLHTYMRFRFKRQWKEKLQRKLQAILDKHCNIDTFLLCTILTVTSAQTVVTYARTNKYAF